MTSDPVTTRHRQESGRDQRPAVPFLPSLEDVERAHVQLVLDRTSTFEKAAELPDDPVPDAEALGLA